MKSPQMLKLVYLLLLLPVVLSCGLAGPLKKIADNAQNPTTLTSPDQRIQIVVPGGWTVDKTLNDIAVIQASNRLSEMYVIVIVEGKEDFEEGTTLDYFASLSRNGLAEKVTGEQSTEPVPFQVSGHSAMEYQMEGSVDNIKIKYICTVIETPTNFYQIFTWTLPSRFEQNRETLRGVMQSFKEVQVKPPPPKPTAT